MENDYWEYLAVGGELHGQIFSATANQNFVDLPIQHNMIGEFSSKESPGKQTQTPTIVHRVHIHALDGKRYAIAYLEPEPAENALDTNELESLIVSSNLKPI